MKNIVLDIMLMGLAAVASAQSSEVKVATYNVDGLPNEIANISINPDGPVDSGSRMISQHLEDSGWDIIGLNEDFNFHDEVKSCMTSYDFQTYTGNIYASASAAFNIVFWQSFRFSCDGLELATKKDMSVSSETIVPWNDDAVYGYLSNQCDGLTKKGFRYYTVTTADNHAIDVIILHADAGDDTPDVKAREAGMSQLYDFITGNIKTSNPLVVMGDFNCLYRIDRLQELFIDRINSVPGLTMEDAGREMGATEYLDKILYMNRDVCSYTLRPTAAELVTDFTRDDGTQLSDHQPMCATFSIEASKYDVSNLTALIGTLNGTVTPSHRYDMDGNGRSDVEDVKAMAGKILR